uniref:separase n=1 Tax=Kwoniella bestiolae CBS 10118 TaxID=1296100 RepID=A0A1B9FT28_9TREE|nr:hypothetical protein I302_08702 [Kwoniella bestiolae CBS 10118]OCF21923.1 hypothetical protein I302_08702 [Kwoniella bestiolae CBS 10118]
MPAAKAASAPKVPPAAPRKTRTTRTAPKQDADDLVEGLGKLNLDQSSQPQAVRRIVKPTTQSSSAGSSSKPAVSASSSSKPTTTARASTTATVKKPTTTISAGTNGKGKAKAISLEDTLPWAQPSSPSDGKPLTDMERVRGAMQAVNVSSKSLSAAVASGFRYTPSPSTSSTISQETKEEWTNEKIDNLLETCQISFRVLREFDEKRKLQGKGLDVERSNCGIITKCISMGMYRRAIDLAVASRPALLRQYTPRNVSSTTGSASVSASSSAPAHSRGQSSSSRSTGKAVSSTPSARSRTTIAKTAPTSECIPEEWLEIARLPVPEDGSELSENLKGVLFLVMMSSWVCLVNLSKDLDQLSPVLSLPNSTDEYLNPLTLALSLPIPSTSFFLHTFYRQVNTATTSPTSSSYLHLRHLALLAMSTTITTSSDCKTTPSQFWDTVHRTVLSFIKEDEQKEKLSEAARVVDGIVESVENMVQRRGEKGWFEGKGWLGLVEMWVGIGRRLGDSSIIDKPLALLASSTSINKTPPSKATIPKTPSSKSAMRKIKNPDAEIARICGDLAKANLAIDKAVSPKSSISSIDGLEPEELILLASSISSLPKTEELTPTVGKAFRAFERVRRGCLRILDKANEPDHEDRLKSLVGNGREWLMMSIEFAEILIDSSILDPTPIKEIIPSLIDTLVQYFRPPQAYSASLPYLARARRLIDQTSSVLSNVDKADYLRCLSSLAYNGAGQLYRLNQSAEAAEMSKISCDWTTESLRLVENESKNEDKSFTLLREGISKRWELLAGCYQRLGKKDQMFTAYSHVFASQPPSLLSQLYASSSTKPLAEIFGSPSMAEVNNPLNRLASLILYEPLPYFTHATELVRLMQENSCPPAVVGAVGEKLLILLEEGEWKDEVAKISLELGDAILGVYGEDYPIRRIRVLAKMMNTILTSGQQMDRFPSLVEEVQKSASQTDLGEDSGLSHFKPEYLSYTLILKAMQAYHTSPHPTLEVIQTSKEAIEQLRGIIIPPSTLDKAEEPRKKVPLGRSTTTKAVRSLATLLGLLGHSLQQIEALKLLRAFQRNKEDLVDDYTLRSGQLATEYQKLGKTSRAGLVFSQAQKVVEHSKVLVSVKSRVELGLRFACYLAFKGDTEKAQDVYAEACTLEMEIELDKNASYVGRVVDRCEQLERAAWARRAAAAIYAAQDNAAAAIIHLSASFRLFSRAADAICRIASTSATSPKAIEDDDPFGAPLPPSSKPKLDGADEPSKDSKTPLPSQTTQFTGKHLHSFQWHIASSLLSTTLDLSNAFAYRGTVRDSEYFLKVAHGIAGAVKSDVILARVGAKEAELNFKMRKWEVVGEKLEEAAGALNAIEGPDMIDLNVLKGDLYSRTEMIEEAEQVFQSTSREIEGLDRVFVANEAVLPTPKKNALLAASTSSVRASLTASRLSQQGKEPLLPSALAHVLRQYAWLLKEAGSKEECEELLSQIKSLPASTETKAEELLLEGRIALHEAFNTFKTDLFMSSLTESAVAMPMGAPTNRVVDRQSTRQSIQHVLARAEDAFLSALSLVSGSGKIEGIRQACLALALLRTFQTSLGEGSAEITAAAAEMLASSSSITLQRELLEAIECKFVDVVNDDLKWPNFAAEDIQVDGSSEVETEDLDDHNGQLRTYWNKIKTKYQTNPLLSLSGDSSTELDNLPSEWAVISINVTDDHNTMFISRHQKNQKPIVFCLPLDRQGRREGDDDSLTFDAALEELRDIIECSNNGARSAKSVNTREDKLAWWEERYRLDGKLKDLCESIEFVWLGAFKTIFSPRLPNPSVIITDLKQRLEKIFDSALSSTSGGGGTAKKGSSAGSTKVQLDDALLECFINLNSKCKDEEVEDLVYFILDVYQFHGVPVALSELDIDQIAIDVKGALEKIESRIALSGLHPPKDEHLFLALDKNVQPFPWESIPILRGRPISRIPSLSFLLDQVAMGNHLRPSLTQPMFNPSSSAPDDRADTRRTVNSRRTFYILNPSGDLERTEQHFKPYIEDMVKKAGWKGIMGRKPTELEMAAALKDYDLVLYFGHGGAEQYIRSHKIRHLPQCATTMLWGCSSGHLKEQGDLDRTGTAWHYMVGGCPSLTANLWDVTDRDIDRLSSHVLKTLHLDSAHLPDSKSRPNTLLPLSELSTVQAVNSARDECKLKYLTGAAPVVYGLPVWLH